MSIFGWSLPPGVSHRQIEEAMGTEDPCAVCGKDVDHCICTECPVCGEVGNPACYIETLRTVSCGCCTKGCICHIHQDIPRGRMATICEHHRKVPHPHVTSEPNHGMVRTAQQIKSLAAAEAQWAAEAKADAEYWERVAADHLRGSES